MLDWLDRDWRDRLDQEANGGASRGDGGDDGVGRRDLQDRPLHWDPRLKTVDQSSLQWPR